jgi:hypothetical protein
MISPRTHTLYLAGPMTGYDRFNFDAFEKARKHLRLLGFAVVCPAEMDLRDGFDPDAGEWTPDHHDAAARRDLLAIANVDAVAVLRGFTASAGARVEITAARWIGLPVVAALNPTTDLSASVDKWLAGRGVDIPLYTFEQGATTPTTATPPARTVLEGTSEAQRGFDGHTAHLRAVDPLVVAERAQDLAEAREHAADSPSSPRPPDKAESGEVRMIDADTGAEKGRKLARFDLLPTGPLTEIAEHYGLGAAKYAERNWERGYAWSLSYGAAQRHLTAFWSGEDLDPELGDTHLSAVAFHILAMMEFARTHPEKDDRPR